MAGFWTTIKRMIVGEPVFQAGDEQKNTPNPSRADVGEWQDAVLPDDTGIQTENPKQYRPLGGITLPSDSSAKSTPKESSVNTQSASDGIHDDRGKKIIPEVEVTRCQTHVSGDHCEVWAHIENKSEVEIELDKITMIGGKKELDYRLTPGNEREFCVFTGPIPHDNYAREAQLYYKIVENGDYFCARHMVEYVYESDNGTYLVEELRLMHPIRDI